MTKVPTHMAARRWTVPSRNPMIDPAEFCSMVLGRATSWY